MRLFLTTILLLIFLGSSAQQSDFIVIKKRNNRTLKTYSTGSSIVALTHDNFNINGIISDIRNDSIFIQQQQTQLIATEFGSKVDTLLYSYGLPYFNIKSFYYNRAFSPTMRKKGFVQVAVPKIMMIGGVGFIVLELVNTIYRKEKLNSGNRLPVLGIAAGVALGGFLIEYLQRQAEKAGGKYKVVYVKSNSLR